MSELWLNRLLFEVLPIPDPTGSCGSTSLQKFHGGTQVEPCDEEDLLGGPSGHFLFTFLFGGREKGR